MTSTVICHGRDNMELLVVNSMTRLVGVAARRVTATTVMTATGAVSTSYSISITGWIM